MESDHGAERIGRVDRRVVEERLDHPDAPPAFEPTPQGRRERRIRLDRDDLEAARHEERRVATSPRADLDHPITGTDPRCAKHCIHHGHVVRVVGCPIEVAMALALGIERRRHSDPARSTRSSATT